MAVGAVAGLNAPRGGADCRRCGACCAAFRVSFHWLELEAAGLPDACVEPIGPHRVAMRGTHAKSPRCTALEGTVGEAVRCTLYAHRPSPCREVEPGDERCATARVRHGLAPLGVADHGRQAAGRARHAQAPHAGASGSTQSSIRDPG
ncbi:MAG: YkgJ family cysteine cluster protein [Burkholderiales bacterium]|nr:YkgJ family cysteine cluster protein [Burkholderiales bacterium]